MSDGRPAYQKPSWERWPPNCCETCIHWKPLEAERWIGTCTTNPFDEITDARFRCPSFSRKEGT